MFERNVVIGSEPFEGLDVLSSVFEYVADDVGPPRLLSVVSLRLGVPVRRLRRLQIRVHLETTAKDVVVGSI